VSNEIIEKHKLVNYNYANNKVESTILMPLNTEFCKLPIILFSWYIHVTTSVIVQAFSDLASNTTFDITIEILNCKLDSGTQHQRPQKELFLNKKKSTLMPISTSQVRIFL
jgi:hypothetical protein